MLDNQNHSSSLDGEIYDRLKIKETVMNEAIEANRLESSTCSSDDDIREIFEKMGWNDAK